MPRTDSIAKPLRADAERNRQRILAAAAKEFAERGLDVSLDDIAQAAGVGVGTVYRRFPSKDLLIDALFEDKIDGIVAIGEKALAEDEPWDGFVAFITGVCEHHARDRGLRDAMFTTGGPERIAEAKARIAPLGEQILRRAQDAGVVRSDVEGFDMPLLHFTVGYAAEKTRCEAPDYWRRLLTIVLDGLRPQRDDTAPMPSPPLTQDQFFASMSALKR